MRDTELEEILDICITLIRSGQATVEDCLRRYADHAPALEPLLREVVRLNSLPPVTMPAKAIEALEQRALSRAAEIRETLSQKERPKRRPLWSRWTIGRMRLLPAALSLVLALAIAGVGTVSASASSLPGETLYPVKLFTERTRLTFTARPGARAELHLMFAERRLAETQVLLDQEDPLEEGLLQALATETTLALEEIEKTSASKKAEIAVKLLALTERQQAVLTSVQERVPEKAQKGLSRALEASQRGRERALMALEVTPEPSLPPPDGFTPTPHTKPTRKPTHTPKPTYPPRAEPTRKPTHTPKPTHTRRATPTKKPDLTNTPTQTPTATRTPKGEDKSSLYFDTGYGCQGDCEEIKAKVCNGQDAGDMATSTTWELYWITSGNPKNGVRVASGVVEPLEAGQCQSLTFDPGHNLNEPSGKYAFKIYQQPDHPGQDELWSETCEITCQISPTKTPKPPKTPKPTKTPKPRD